MMVKNRDVPKCPSFYAGQERVCLPFWGGEEVEGEGDGGWARRFEAGMEPGEEWSQAARTVQLSCGDSSPSRLLPALRPLVLRATADGDTEPPHAASSGFRGRWLRQSAGHALSRRHSPYWMQSNSTCSVHQSGWCTPQACATLTLPPSRHTSDVYPASHTTTQRHRVSQAGA